MKAPLNIQNVFLLAAIAAICGGSVPVTAKIALEAFQPFSLVSVRFFFACLFLLPFMFKRKELNLSLFKSLIPVALAGALNPIILFIALPYTQASISPLIYAIIPVMTAVYLFFTRGDRLSTKQTLGIFIGFIGVATIILLPLLETNLPVSALKGNVLIFIAAIFSSAYGIMSKQKQQKVGASPLALTFYFCLMGLLIGLPFSYHEMATKGFLVPLEFKHLFFAILTGVIGTGVFYWVYQKALKYGTEVSAALFTYLQPVITLTLAWLLLGETITPTFIFGGVLAILGARLASAKKA